RVGLVISWLDLREEFGILLRIQIVCYSVGIMMINLKTGVEIRFGIREYMRINFGSSKFVKNFIKVW
ncbi:hypothetical protein DF186_20660, partial [Enterococcus hirae]